MTKPDSRKDYWPRRPARFWALGWGLPFVALLGATLALLAHGNEIALMKRFFHAEGDPAWPWEDHWFPRTMYWAAGWPANAMGAGGLLVGIASFYSRRLYRFRRAAWFLTLFWLLIPGLVVNVVGKDQTSRPRPWESAIFGGPYEYRVPLEAFPVIEEGAKSFPSGHAAIAFTLMAPFFLFYLTSERRRWAWRFLLSGCVWGTLSGLARIVGGEHWPTDVLWSFGAVYLCGWLLAAVFGYFPWPFPRTPGPLPGTPRGAVNTGG